MRKGESLFKRGGRFTIEKLGETHLYTLPQSSLCSTTFWKKKLHSLSIFCKRYHDSRILIFIPGNFLRNPSFAVNLNSTSNSPSSFFFNWHHQLQSLQFSKKSLQKTLEKTLSKSIPCISSITIILSYNSLHHLVSSPSFNHKLCVHQFLRCSGSSTRHQQLQSIINFKKVKKTLITKSKARRGSCRRRKVHTCNSGFLFESSWLNECLLQ